MKICKNSFVGSVKKKNIFLCFVIPLFYFSLSEFQPAEGAEQPLVPVAGKKSCLTWSPSGEAIALLAERDSETRLIVYSLNNGRPVDLGVASAFAWSPSGKSLAIVRPGDSKGNIISISSWPKRKEKTVAYGSDPVFSRNGKSVAFVRNGCVFGVSVRGGSEQALTRKAMMALRLSAAGPGFFMTGDGLLWYAKPGREEKMILRNDGMGTGTGGLEYYINLAVNPDGGKIILVSSGGQNAGGAPSSLLVVNPDGSGKKTIGPGSEPCWARDGKRFVFVSMGDLWLCTVASGKVKRLTDRRIAGHGWPAWSPDGKQLAFIVRCADTSGDGKIDWQDEPSVSFMNVP